LHHCAPVRAYEGATIDALHSKPAETQAAAWRRDLKAKIAWTMVAKTLALVLLWLLFFRGRAS